MIDNCWSFQMYKILKKIVIIFPQLIENFFAILEITHYTILRN